MGIFTNTAALNEGTSYVDLFSPAEVELQTEGCEINFTEAAVVAVAECEEVYNKSMKAIGIGELMFMESHGHEIIYEAVDLKAIGEKIKMFFKKVIDKVKAILHAFIVKMSSFFSSGKGFVDKYKKEFVRKWADVKGDFEFKGYKFTIAGISKDGKVAKDNMDGFNTKLGTILAGVGIASGDVTFDASVTTDDLSTKAKKIKEDSEEEADKARAAAYDLFATKFATGSKSTSTAMDSKEFSEELFKVLRNGEDTKESIEKSSLSTTDIITPLENEKKVKDAATTVSESIVKQANKCIDIIDKAVTKIVKTLPTKTGDDKKAADDLGNAKIAFITAVSDHILKPYASACVTGQGIVLQAIKDNVSQNKAIMAKVIAGGGKKMTEESVDYGHGSTGSFLDSVVVR